MNWEDTKKLLASNFAKYSLLVPLIGWLVIYNGEFQRFFSEALGVTIDNNAGTDWRVLAFYLGLVLIGVSSGLFRVSCPPEILAHDGLGGYIDDTTAHLTEMRFSDLCRLYSVELPEFKGPDTAVFDQGAFVSQEQWVRMRADDIFNVLAARYSLQLTARPVWRFLTLALFGVGAVVTLIPTMSTILWVLTELMSQITS